MRREVHHPANEEEEEEEEKAFCWFRSPARHGADSDQQDGRKPLPFDARELRHVCPSLSPLLHSVGAEVGTDTV